MKPHLTDPDMTHSRADIAAQNREIGLLCAAILPHAQSLVEQGVASHTAQAAGAVLAGETDAMLRSMLAELDDGIDARQRDEQLDKQLSNDVEADDLLDDDRQWISRLGADFALAAATFWLDLGTAAADRMRRQELLMRQLHAGRHDDGLAAFDLIAARFYVDQRGRALLTTLNDLSHLAYSLPLSAELSPEPYIIVQEYGGAYVQKST